MNAKLIGKLLVVAGFLSIVAGIIAKRGFHMAEKVFVFHGIGGLLLAIGIAVIVLTKSEPS